jgi:hypothetical protein
VKSTIIQVWLSLIVRIGVFEPTMIVNKYLRSNGISTIGRSEKTNGVGAHSYTTTHRNKFVIADEIKHIFIVLVLPTKSVIKHLRTCHT